MKHMIKLLCLLLSLVMCLGAVIACADEQIEPDKQPTHEDMMRLRAAFQGAKGIRPLEGMRLMNEYRQKYMK